VIALPIQISHRPTQTRTEILVERNRSAKNIYTVSMRIIKMQPYAFAKAMAQQAEDCPTFCPPHAGRPYLPDFICHLTSGLCFLLTHQSLFAAENIQPGIIIVQ
jgi:hypothetical protein